MRISNAERALARLDGVLDRLPSASEVCEAALRREAIALAGAGPCRMTLRNLLLFEAVGGASSADAAATREPVLGRANRHLGALVRGTRRVDEEGTLTCALLLDLLSDLIAGPCDSRSSASGPAAGSRADSDTGGSREASIHARIPPDIAQAISELCAALGQDPGPNSVIIGASMLHRGIAPLGARMPACGPLGRIAPLLLIDIARRPFLSLGSTMPTFEDCGTHRVDVDPQHAGRRADKGCPREAAALFADAIVAGVDRALAVLARIADLIETDRRRIEALTKAAHSAFHVHAALQRRPIISLPRLLEDTGLGVQSATSALHRLRGLGIAREITGRYRHRMYSYDAYLALLGEEMV